MIQSLPSKRREWILFWTDLDEPLSSAQGVILPTVMVICDGEGIPLAPPGVFPEIDQSAAENLLGQMIEQLGRPDRLSIGISEDWDEEAWRNFSSETGVPLRFQKMQNDSLLQVLETVKSVEGRKDSEATPTKELAAALWESAKKLRSLQRKEAYLRKLLEIDPELMEAKIELADLEFSRGQWKKCLRDYDHIITLAEKKPPDGAKILWTEPATRPYLRALFGKGMTLWHQAKYLDAVACFEHLLEINPTDHQGVRFFIPLLFLLADQLEEASAFFAFYEKAYRDDFSDPAMWFGWAYTLHLQGEEAAARKKYEQGMLKNIYLAPLLLETPLPCSQLWFPSDRAEPGYAEEFVDSYAPLWDREASSLRLVREAWEDLRLHVERIVAHRQTMLDFQDQRYDPAYRKKWEEMVRKEEQLTTAETDAP